MDRPFIKVDQLQPRLTQQLLNNYQELYALGKDGETAICQINQNGVSKSHAVKRRYKTYLQKPVYQSGRPTYMFSSTLKNSEHYEELPVILQPLFNYMKRRYGEEFNSVVVNFYDDKDNKIPYHQDYDATIPDDSVIAIITLNEVSTDARTLRFKSECTNVHIQTTSGSVILFNKRANMMYWHGVLTDSEIAGSRISITFRRFDKNLSTPHKQLILNNVLNTGLFFVIALLFLVFFT